MAVVSSNPTEWDLLVYTSPKEEDVSNLEEVAHVQKGQYADALTTSFANDFFTKNEDVPTLEAWSTVLVKRMGIVLEQAKDQGTQADTALRFLAMGQGSLNCFLQVAWTGPPLSLDPTTLLPSSLQSTTQASHSQNMITQALSMDGEHVYRLTPGLHFLFLARTILVEAEDLLAPHTPSVRWWAARTLFTHQRILNDRSATLHDAIFPRLSDLPLPADNANLSARYALERGLVHHWYGNDQKSLDDYRKAQEHSGLVFQVTGALGKRTKFQQNDLSQLVVLASSSSMEEKDAGQTGSSDKPSPPNPETLPLEDDTLLEEVAFTDKDEAAISNLAPIDQCLLLAHCLNVRNTNPAHGLTTEQMMPYVSRVLGHPNNWSIHTTALLLRSRLESNKTRTVERGVLQLQALVDQIPLDDSSVAGAPERLRWCHSLALPAKWELEKELAERFMSIGVIRSALEIFERLQLWDDVISCHQMLGEEDRAEALVKEQLDKKGADLPWLYCILGDLRKDPVYWEKAWEESGKRYARAQRSLGAYYFKEEQWDSSMAAYRLALKLNPLFEHSWFMLGCAAMHQENWEDAAEAFHRVVTMENNAEAWNNLGSVYLHLKRKREAFNAFQQALKEKYDSWKIWQNYLYVSVEVGEVAEGILAVRRILDLRVEAVGAAAVDVEVLRILIRVLMRMAEEEGAEGSESTPKNTTALTEALNRRERLSRHMEDLLINCVTARITDSAEIWRLCADFWRWRTDWVRCLDAYLKAYRATLHRSPVETDKEAFETAAAACLDVVEAYENFGDISVPDEEGPVDATRLVAPDWHYQSRGLLRSLIGRSRGSFEGTEWHDRLSDRLADLKANPVKKSSIA
ncbi:MAG: hypothetical protein DHS80DRAFT_15059 [Piptocephalis tieghemiana]|nr:MAG: hypothetical protein DHS80DRAFT_15059 [Piptocephalis tieghemiana]